MAHFLNIWVTGRRPESEEVDLLNTLEPEIFLASASEPGEILKPFGRNHREPDTLRKHLRMLSENVFSFHSWQKCVMIVWRYVIMKVKHIIT